MEVDSPAEKNTKGKQVESLAEEPMKTLDPSKESNQTKDGFEPLAQTYYEGKHISEPVKEIKVCFLLEQRLLQRIIALNSEF